MALIIIIDIVGNYRFLTITFTLSSFQFVNLSLKLQQITRYWRIDGCQEY